MNRLLADFAAAETLVIDLDQEVCALGLANAAGPIGAFLLPAVTGLDWLGMTPPELVTARETRNRRWQPSPRSQSKPGS
jgi:hypothetical protein